MAQSGHQQFNIDPLRNGAAISIREISMEDVKRILLAHEKWIETDGAEGELADFTYTRLKDIDFDFRNLKSADFSGAILDGISFHRSTLQNARFCGAEFLKAKLTRADLSEADLRGAGFVEGDFSDANLTKATLDGALLEGSRFDGASLLGTKIRKARLEGASFSNGSLLFADFQGSHLRKAQFQPANQSAEPCDLTGASFRDCDFADATITPVIGLQSAQLGGADVSNAKISAHVARFEGLAHAEAVSRHARNVFLAVIAGCIYSWLTIATTTDVALLTNFGSSPLPIIQTNVPIAGFYWAAPAILLGLYVYLHMYLQRLWTGLASLPAVFEDGRTLEERAYPWLLTSLASAHMPRLANRRPVFSRLQVFLSILTAWVLVPFTIGWFWLRYLPLHDWSGTSLHIGLFTVSVVFAINSYWVARATLKGHEIEKFEWRIFWIRRSTYMNWVVAILFTSLSVGVSDGAINGTPADIWKGRRPLAGWHQNYVPRAFALVNFRPFLDLAGQDVSVKPSNWTGLFVDPGEGAQVRGAKLAGKDLRWANASGAFMMNADLSRAKLYRADLESADLRNADFLNAVFHDTRIGSANLTGAKHLTQEQIDHACASSPPELPTRLNPPPRGWRSC